MYIFHFIFFIGYAMCRIKVTNVILASGPSNLYVYSLIAVLFNQGS